MKSWTALNINEFILFDMFGCGLFDTFRACGFRQCCLLLSSTPSLLPTEEKKFKCIKPTDPRIVVPRLWHIFNPFIAKVRPDTTVLVYWA